MLALSLSGIHASAQSGSVGGTIGNKDKGVSGGHESAPPRRVARPAPAPRATPACKLASVWSNEVSGLGTSVWTISAGGVAIERGIGNALGRASLAGRNLSISFHTCCNNGTYVVQLDAACTSGHGKATVIGGWSAGTVYPVTFTAVPN